MKIGIIVFVLTLVASVSFANPYLAKPGEKIF
jgi:hypothetical protein